MIDLFNLFMGDYYEKNKSYMWGLIVISLLFIISESILAPYFISNILNNLKNYEKYLLYAFILYVIIFVLFYFKKKYEKDIFADLITLFISIDLEDSSKAIFLAILELVRKISC